MQDEFWEELEPPCLYSLYLIVCLIHSFNHSLHTLYLIYTSIWKIMCIKNPTPELERGMIPHEHYEDIFRCSFCWFLSSGATIYFHCNDISVELFPSVNKGVYCLYRGVYGSMDLHLLYLPNVFSVYRVDLLPLNPLLPYLCFFFLQMNLSYYILL